jgi:hypothetical protein
MGGSQTRPGNRPGPDDGLSTDVLLITTGRERLLILFT